MTKSELIEELAGKTPEISRRDVEIVVDEIFNMMTNSLANKERIEIRGFGSFVAKKRRARGARNPKTGASVSVPEKWVPFFTLGKELRDRINE